MLAALLIAILNTFLAAFLLIRMGVYPMQDDLQGLKDVLKQADEKALCEIIRQAEKFLDSQLAAGVAADQRAATFASVLAAVVAVLLGGYLGTSGLGALGLAMAPVLLGLVLAIVLAVIACRPTDWHYAGSNPRHWREDIESGTPFAEAQAGQARLYAKGIVANRDVLKVNALLMIWAMGIAVASIAAGVAMALIISGTSPPAA